MWKKYKKCNVLELQQKFICVRKSEIFVQNVKKWYVWENVRVVLEKVRSIKIIEMCKKKWERQVWEKCKKRQEVLEKVKYMRGSEMGLKKCEM